VAYRSSMFHKYPSFRVRRKVPNGQLFEMEIRPSLLRWLLVLLLILVWLVQGVPIEKLVHVLPRIQMHLPQGRAYMLREWGCDLFPVFCVGPAVVWSHFAPGDEARGDPYSTADFSATMHPADHARMSVMRQGLEFIGLSLMRARGLVLRRPPYWETLGAQPEAEYIWCYPKSLLSQIAEHAGR
jgi:hypothetical protein